MKKKLAILFLFVLFVSQIGYYFIYLYQQHEIKEAVKEQILKTIPEHLLLAINADANEDDIEWEEEGREFSMNGKMYDVAYIKIINGEQIIYCINDEKEEELLKNFSKTVGSTTDNTNGKDAKHSIKFQLVDFLVPTPSTITTFITQPAIQQHAAYDVAIISSVKEVNIPPPKLNFMSKTYLL